MFVDFKSHIFNLTASLSKSRGRQSLVYNYIYSNIIIKIVV